MRADDHQIAHRTTLSSSSTTSTSALTTPPVIPTTTTPTTPTTTPAPVQQGPVGQPAPTTDAGQTVYVYTTTDANGDLEEFTATFTPSYQPLSTAPFTTTGTVLSYSDWLGLVGTNTVAAQQPSSGMTQWAVPSAMFKIAAGVAAGVLGGAWLVFA